MRFRIDGPDIPAALLRERDLGNMVLFCGAGISRPSGLPDFQGLAVKLVTELRAGKAAEALADRESLDRVFTALVKEVGRGPVDAQISQALATSVRADLRYHEIALALSQSLEGKPQIVTTNFDLLFEAVDAGLPRFVPPVLPDLSFAHSFDGLVYLHGRLSPPDPWRTAGYVIGSADFGRAYLAEGWAARFVRDLRERYTIVLLGYSANDPPMRYLLEGMNARDGVAYRTPIYAFAEGRPEDVTEDWLDRGVTAIPYDRVDAGHSGLWDSLAAWAEAARAPQARHAALVELAQAGPRRLAPYQRGQILHFVGTKDGAQAFAAADPPPPAEWLCAFDPNVRYAKPGRALFEKDAPEIDPLDLYGLDRDPPRPLDGRQPIAELGAADPLQWQAGDPAWPDRLRLGRWSSDGFQQLPPRLFHLARWFGRVADQPAAIWWAAGSAPLHPQLIDEVAHRMRAPGMADQPRFFWRRYLAAARQAAARDEGLRWHALSEQIDRDGWDDGVVRELEQALIPYHDFARDRMKGPVPLEGDWSTLDLRQLVEITARIPTFELEPDGLDDTTLVRIVAAMRRTLVTTAALLAESTTVLWRTPTLHRTGDRGEYVYGRKAHFFLRFARMIDALIGRDAGLAAREIGQWPDNEPFFFLKLSLYVLADERLFDARAAARTLLAIPADQLLDHGHRRELLFALRARWPGWSVRDRRAIERRILARRPAWEGESRAQCGERSSADAAQMLAWLQSQGCVLTERSAARLPALIAKIPYWSPAFIASADDSHEPRGGFVRRDTALQGLDAVPLDQVLAEADRLSTDSLRDLVDFRPFEGLVGTSPAKALVVLRRAARRGDHPLRYWRNLLSDFPEGAPIPVRCAVLAALAGLPDPILYRHRYEATRWLATHMPALVAAKGDAAFGCFDRIVAKLSVAPADILDSAIGVASVGGVPQERSEVSIGKAINAPGGHLANMLLDMLGEVEAPTPLPPAIARRIEQLFALPGHGGGHAMACIARRLAGLYYRDPAWTEAHILPAFSLDHPLAEAAWHGISGSRHLLPRQAERMILPPLIDLLAQRAPFAVDNSDYRSLTHRLMALTEGDPPLVNRADLAGLLPEITDEGRAEILADLAIRTERGEWASQVAPVLDEAWPRHIRFRSEATTHQLGRIAELAGDDFPAAARIVTPLIRPIPHVDAFSHRLLARGEDATNPIARFPQEALRLLAALIGDDRANLPYNILATLEALADAAPALRRDPDWIRLRDMVG